MPLVPAFKIGLWNAWILMLLYLAVSTVFFYLGRAGKRAEEQPTWSELEQTTRIANRVTHNIILPFTLLYSLFLPLKLGTPWFLAGLPVCFLALVMLLMCGIAWATAPLGKPLTKGVYAVSRHPQYSGFCLGFAGIGIACASWVFLLCALAWIVAWHFGVIEEERLLLDTYGDAYREYVNRTPRWIGLPKSR